MAWDVGKLANAFQVTENDIREYLTDGRRASFIVERRLKWEHPGWELAESEGAGYDLIDPEGHTWEVRSLTKGIYFTPSNQVGSGRRFDKESFLEEIFSIRGFIVCDLYVFPKIDFYVVPSENIERWWNARYRVPKPKTSLDASAKCSRKKFHDFLKHDIVISEKDQTVIL